ncbi:MAG: hypothetical protein FWD36_07460 [Treponema sp.]|nr:hypothetical protein [Treponema sp.]
MKRSLQFLCIFLIFIPCLSLGAKDIGLLLDQNMGYGGINTSDTAFDYSGILIPRFSTLLGDSGELYISAGVKADYLNDAWTFVPELLRTEFFWDFGNAEIKIGRMQYADPLGFIAEGLFDGARFSFDTTAGTFSLGTWYTGLLHKKRANIAMNGRESESFYDTDTYFAPSRLLSAMDWEHPALGDLVRLRLSLLGQSDLSGKDDYLHSQYLAAKLTILVNTVVFDLGGGLEVIQDTGDTGIAMVGELGFAWSPPAAIDSELSLLGRFSSGVIEDSSVREFLPLTTVTQGNVLKAKISGLSMISLDYLARLHRAFSAGFTASCFVRSDEGTHTSYPVGGGATNGEADGKYVLGTELFGRLLWSPVSDMQFTLGGGAFLPSMGNVNPDAGALWRVELNVILALY